MTEPLRRKGAASYGAFGTPSRIGTIRELGVIVRSRSATSETLSLKEGHMLSKFRALSAEKQAEIEREVDAALKVERNKVFVLALSSVSDESFRKIWDNPKDADYDSL